MVYIHSPNIMSLSSISHITCPPEGLHKCNTRCDNCIFKMESLCGWWHFVQTGWIVVSSSSWRISRSATPTSWLQHCKDSVTPTRVKATNCKHMIEHIQETFVQIQLAINKTFSHQTTGISAFVPSHFPLKTTCNSKNRERFYIWQAVSWCFFQ